MRFMDNTKNLSFSRNVIIVIKIQLQLIAIFLSVTECSIKCVVLKLMPDLNIWNILDHTVIYITLLKMVSVGMLYINFTYTKCDVNFNFRKH